MRLVTRLLASTRASFGSDGIDPEEDRLVVGVKLRRKDLDNIPVAAGNTFLCNLDTCSGDKFN